MMIVTFEKRHIDTAAQLFARRMAECSPRDFYGDDLCAPDAWRPSIEWLCGAGEGIALMDGDTLVGYMLGLPIDAFMGPAPGIYCPEFGHGASDPSVYPDLYRAAADRWTAAGHITHAVSVLAGDEPAREGLIWQGFGLHVVDSLLPGLTISAGKDTGDHGVMIRLADEGDSDALDRLIQRHWEHLAASPVFLNWEEDDTIENWKSREGYYAIVAEDETGVRGCMLAVSPDEESSALVRGDGTIGIGVTYVEESLRGRGVARRMLAGLLGEARRRGYTKCAVDFEAGNIEARRFWLRYFTPVSLSLLRRISPRR